MCDIEIQYDTNDAVYWGLPSDPFPRPTFRLHGPAYILPIGVVRFCDVNKSYSSRTVGPAIIYPDGVLVYLTSNKRHRDKGPAVINADGSKEYWVNNKQLEPVEFFTLHGSV